MSLSLKLMWRSHASVGCGYAMNHESGNVTTVVVAAYEPVAIADNIDDFIENVLTSLLILRKKLIFLQSNLLDIYDTA